MAAAVALEPPGQEDLVVLQRAVQDAFDLASQLRRIQFKTPRDAQLLGAGAQQVRRAALAQEQTEGAEQQRFAGAGLAGPGTKARLQLDARVLDKGQVLHR